MFGNPEINRGVGLLGPCHPDNVGISRIEELIGSDRPTAPFLAGVAGSAASTGSLNGLDLPKICRGEGISSVCPFPRIFRPFPTFTRVNVGCSGVMHRVCLNGISLRDIGCCQWGKHKKYGQPVIGDDFCQEKSTITETQQYTAYPRLDLGKDQPDENHFLAK